MGELVAELAPLFVGTHVQDVQALPPRDILLVCDIDGEESEGGAVRRLRLSAHGDGPRLHLQCDRVHRHKGPPGPFFRLLADELEGARVARLAQVRGDRLVRIELRGTPSGEPRTILAELTGRHANLILLGGGDRVLAMLVAPPAGRGGAAPRLQVGRPWEVPPGKPPSGAGAPSIDDVFPAPPPAPRSAAQAPLSWRIEAFLGGAVEERHEGRARKSLVERVERRLKRARSMRAGLEKRKVASDGAERVRLDGELLKANLGAVPRGAASIEVADWFEEGAPPRTIQLDPKRGPSENMERLFERAKKLERARDSVELELTLAGEKVAALEALLERAKDEAADPEAIEHEAVKAGLLTPPQAPPERKKPTAPRLPYRRFAGLSGAEILVGRTARDNDELTLKIARGNDLWLHTADAPGSHVVLRVHKGAEPDPEDVLDAALLAVHYSPLKDATRADVHVARKKEVHKPRGAKPGLVTLSGGRTMHVRSDPGRLRRLLSPERAERDR